MMISLTYLGHGDSLGTVNRGGDGFTDSSHSDKKSLLPLFTSVGATFFFYEQLSILEDPIGVTGIRWFAHSF
jgi:hypothetical protein